MEYIIKKEKLFLTIIFAIFFFTAFFKFTTNPASWFDEGIYHQVVSNLVNHEKMSVQLSPGVYADSSLISVGYPVFYPAAWFVTLFGNSIMIVRLVAILFMLAFFIVFYLLAKKLYGAPAAMASLFLLALFSPLYGNGKNLLGEVPGLFYFVSALLIISYYPNNQISAKKNFWTFFLSGVLFGLAAASKPTYLVILPALVFACIYKWRFFFVTKLGRQAMFFIALGAIISLAVWVITQFSSSTSVTQIFSHYSNPYYLNSLWPLILSNIKRFVTESTPAHFLILSLFAAYLLIGKIIKKTSLNLVELIVAAFCGAIIIFYVRTVGWYRYFFPAHVIMFLFIGGGVEYLLNNSFIFLKNYQTRLFITIIMIFAILQCLPMIKERFFTQTDVPTALESYLNSIPAGQTVLFYSLPQLAARYNGNNYYQYLKMSDVLSLGKDNLNGINGAKYDVIFIEEGIDINPAACYNEQVMANRIKVLTKNQSQNCK